MNSESGWKRVLASLPSCTSYMNCRECPGLDDGGSEEIWALPPNLPRTGCLAQMPASRLTPRVRAPAPVPETRG